MSETTKTVVPGAFGWNEMVTSNAEESVKFYTELLGWTTEVTEMPGMTYTTFKQGDTPVGGCFQPDKIEEGFKPFWMPYINTVDLDASIEKSKALGAKVLHERTDLPMGSFAIISDPSGASFSFWQDNPDYACSSEG